MKDVAQLTFTIPLHKIYRGLKTVAAAFTLYNKLQPNSGYYYITQDFLARFDFLEMELDNAIQTAGESQITAFFRSMIDSFPVTPERRRRSIDHIQNPISPNRTAQIINEDPTRFIKRIEDRKLFLDYEMIYKTNTALSILQRRLDEIPTNAARNATIVKDINAFIVKLEEYHYFQRIPVLLQGIQSLAKGRLMHNFLSAKALNSAIEDLMVKLSQKNSQVLSVKKLADLYALPVSFIRQGQKYYSLISIPITYESEIDTHEITRKSYMFIRSDKPYYLTIDPSTTMIAPTQNMKKDFVFKQKDLSLCIRIRNRKFCPMTLVQTKSVQKCLISIYYNKIADIYQNCPIKVTKINGSKTVALGSNKYQTTSTKDQIYDVTCNKITTQHTYPKHHIYQFTLDRNCTKITTPQLTLIQDATDRINRYTTRPLNVTGLVNMIFRHYPVDISAEFSISNSRAIDTLLANPKRITPEEGTNILLGTVTSLSLAFLLLVCKRFCKCKFNVKRSHPRIRRTTTFDDLEDATFRKATVEPARISEERIAQFHPSEQSESPPIYFKNPNDYD